MANSSYDLDDILNEVKKRREESEAKIKGVSADAEAQSEAEENNEIEAEAEAETDEPAEENASEAAESENEPAEEIAEPEEADEETDTDGDSESEAQNAEEDELSEQAEESVDLFALSEQEELKKDQEDFAEKNKSSQKWHKTKSGKICISVIALLCVAILAVGAYGYVYINGALNKITQRDENNSNLEGWSGMSDLVENFDPIYEQERGDISSYRDMIKKWYYNGTPVSSTHVLNVLLIGEDTREVEIEESGYRADSAIIVSVNTDSGEIVLTSILRDSYAYWEETPGDESTGHFSKINESMSIGGVNCYINCVEHMFKVNIDNYVIVNFDSFESIVDTLGGVTVEMTRAEIREINNHQKRYNYVTIDGEPGELQLNGKQALAYCRIRKIDSDSARADRQKTVLLELFKKMKSASTLKSVEVATELLPYVKTGFSKSEILSIGKYGISHGWLSYDTITHTMPANETQADGTVITTCKGGTYYGAWIWKVDYPLCSQLLQNKIYGKTSVVLAERRPNFLELKDY